MNSPRAVETFSLNLNAFKVMMVFFKIWPEIVEEYLRDQMETI